MSDSTRSNAAVTWQLRKDIEVYPADECDTAWTMKDPVRLLYFRLENEELSLLKLLDGKRSWATIQQKLQQQFPEVEFHQANLVHFLAGCINRGLLAPTMIGYGEHLASLNAQQRRADWGRRCLSLISHRFTGFDPTPLLKLLNQCFGWIFHRQVITLAIGLMLFAVVQVAAHGSQLQMELPTLSQLMGPRNLLVLGLTIAIVKLLHEIGHGLTCYHFGGECHELGCILIGFLPLLYCDVSDSWLQRHPKHRIYVAFAGIFVELFLAAVFAVLWLTSVPGMIHSFFLNGMLVCSLNTLLINGNPLMRYDGYYVLSDLLKFPNLGPESRAAAVRLFDRTVLGIHSFEEDFSSFLNRLWLPLFGIASGAYRLTVLVTILIVFHSVLKPFHLEGLTYLVAFTTVVSLLLGGIMFVRQRVRLVQNDRSGSLRAMIGLLVFLSGTCALLLWPFPHSIEAPFTLTPGTSTPIFVDTPGHVDPLVDYGNNVDSNKTIAILFNPELTQTIAKLEGELRLAQARKRLLESSRIDSQVASTALPAAAEAIQNAQDRLETLRKKALELEVRSPRSGIIYPPRARQKEADSHLKQSYWTGSPLDKDNQSAWLEEQTLIGWVGTTSDLRALAYVAQIDVELIQPDGFVTLRFQSMPGRPISGTLQMIDSLPTTSAPSELVATGNLLIQRNTGELTETVFGAHIQPNITENEIPPPLYSIGTAHIQCVPMSLLARFKRLLSHTFAFEL